MIDLTKLNVGDVVYYNGLKCFLDEIQNLEEHVFNYVFSDHDKQYEFWFSVVVGKDFANFSGGDISLYSFDLFEDSDSSDNFDLEAITLSEIF